ncbi:MAG: hydroxylamine oxidoreductase [Magnetococcales bacterium]|nr:hydroxylamine oxidoreductase [Magnetococcales bacterium]
MAQNDPHSRPGPSAGRLLPTVLSILALWAALSGALALAEDKAEPEKSVRSTFDSLSKDSAICLSCHVEEHRGLYQQWGRSKHYGANVGCYECHRAEAQDPDAFMHKKYLISVLVTPKDCGRCHEKEYQQFSRSSHAHAGNFAGTPADTLAKVVQGTPHEAGLGAAMNGCWQCHGSKVAVTGSGKLDPATWPNSGIGRINPDGSLGACSACHQRHEFSQIQARRPEACGKCHLGPAHPQKQIYDESKHGINFYANVNHLNLDSSKWVPGEDFDTAPTCATCHMSATLKTPLTHDTGERISWNLRGPIAMKVDELKKQDEKQAEGKKSADDKRNAMQEVCVSCHTEKMVEGFYSQFDSVVELYNEKFARPGLDLMQVLEKTGLRTPKEFDDPIEWTWFKIWHLAGRRVRHGASMMAPDYVQWQGFYEIGELFYTRLLPQAEEMADKAWQAGNKTQATEVRDLIDKIRSRPDHLWSKRTAQ